MQIVNVSKNVGEDNALILDDVNFQVFSGELVVILGPSGAGKSTLLNLIGGLDRPTVGEVKIGQTTTTVLSEDVLSSFRCLNVGFIFQTYNLISTLTALENVQFPMKLAGCEDEAIIDKRSIDLLTAVGLIGKSGHLSYQLSCGEQQRVAIARTLALKPEIILFDEPMSALDAETRLQLRDELKVIQKEFNTTMVYVTHDQEEAFAMSDRIMVMDAGKMMQIGTPETIINEPANEYVTEFVVNSLKLKMESLRKYIK